MRVSSTLVLSTLAIGQAAAASIRHAGFHARRHAESKRDDNGLLGTSWGDAIRSVDQWKEAVKDVNWDEALKSKDWSEVFGNSASSAASSTAAATSTAAPPPPPPPAPTSTQPESSTAAASSSAAPAASSSPAAVVEPKKKTSEVGNFVNGLIDDIEDWATELIPRKGVNSDSDNGRIWLGDSGKFTATFTNEASKDIMIVCWEDNTEYTGFVMTKQTPLIKTKIPQGKSQKISFGSVSGSCAPAYKGLEPSHSGGIYETWLEFTFGKNDFSTFDVSRLPRMDGMNISAKTTKNTCVSDMEQCVFKCKDGKNVCTWGDEVELVNTDRTPHCHKGKFAGGDQGGCLCNKDGEHVEVTIS